MQLWIFIQLKVVLQNIVFNEQRGVGLPTESVFSQKNIGREKKSEVEILSFISFQLVGEIKEE